MKKDELLLEFFRLLHENGLLGKYHEYMDKMGFFDITTLLNESRPADWLVNSFSWGNTTECDQWADVASEWSYYVNNLAA